MPSNIGICTSLRVMLVMRHMQNGQL